MSRVIHFEIPAAVPERAAAFYKKAFEWSIEKWPGPMEY
jgi:predicted enzyme related to lactoylglutathione lyase